MNTSSANGVDLLPLAQSGAALLELAFRADLAWWVPAALVHALLGASYLSTTSNVPRHVFNRSCDAVDFRLPFLIS